MGQFQPKTFETILERMINRVVARTALTDIHDGSSIKQVLAAAAREDDDAYFQMLNLLDLFDIDKVIGADLDERAKEFNPGLIARLLARKATGEVVFSRVGTSGTITIPIGTRVQVPASGAQAAVVFVTTEEGSIPNASTTASAVDVVAEVAGAAGNAAAGSITGFVSRPAGVDFVTNLGAFVNGQDYETDDAFRQRLKRQIQGLARCHIGGIEAAVTGLYDAVSGKTVAFVQVIENPYARGDVTVYIDDGSGTAESTTQINGEVVIASAVGRETVLFLDNKPLKTTATYVVYQNATPLVEGTDYTINPASGQINLLPGPFPTGLAPADEVTADYRYYTGLIQLAQKVVDGDAADRANYPGYRAAGVLARVLPPVVEQQIVTANITVLQGFSQTDIAARVKTALSGYVNALGIGDDVILAELIERAMAVPGMADIRFVVPTENTVILDGHLARLLTSNMTIA